MDTKSHDRKIKTVLVTGGAGYVGSVLVPKLLAKNYHVRVLDWFLFEPDVFAGLRDNPNLEEIKGDLRDSDLLSRALKGADAVIHLACISNDPSFELNPELGRSINSEGNKSVISAAHEARVTRLIYASTSSVYGIKDEENVTENLVLEPLADYSRYKAEGEKFLMSEGAPYFTAVAIRSATVCGYSPRMRFDLTVNILTNNAWNKGTITVLGGEQKRPNIHIEDITDLYSKLLEYPAEKIHKKIYNAGAKNYTVKEIALLVKEKLENDFKKPVRIEYTGAGSDRRSYHISSELIKKELGFEARRSLGDAVRDLCGAFQRGEFQDPLTNFKYFNVKMLQASQLA